MIDKKLISIICPCFNEAEAFPAFYIALTETLDKLDQFVFEIVLVDDGSSDSTLRILNNLAANDDRIQVYSFSRNFGHQAALLAGLNKVNINSAAAITLDSDLQHPPQYIPSMIDAWVAGKHIVSMVRNSKSASLAKRLSSMAYYRLINFFSEVTIVENCADFSLLDRKVVDAISTMKEKDLFLRGIVAWVGFDRTYIEYIQPNRISGVSKYTLSKMVALASNSLFSFSTKPIQMSIKFGLVFLIFSISYLFYAIGAFLFGVAVPGWTSIIASVVFFGGINLFAVGLIGEYISRIYNETKQRPSYIFKQTPQLSLSVGLGSVNKTKTIHSA